MEFKTFVFYFFSAILVFAGLRVITSRNPVHAALFLVLAFFSAAGVWMLLQAEFLAIALILIYVGAVMVLFLFVVRELRARYVVVRVRDGVDRGRRRRSQGRRDPRTGDGVRRRHAVGRRVALRAVSRDLV